MLNRVSRVVCSPPLCATFIRVPWRDPVSSATILKIPVVLTAAAYGIVPIGPFLQAVTAESSSEARGTESDTERRLQAAKSPSTLWGCAL